MLQMNPKAIRTIGAVLALISLWMVPNHAASQIITTTSSNFWEDSIEIGKHRKWVEGSAHISIVLRHPHERIYVPRNLIDAFGELNADLPSNFVNYMVAHGSSENCLVDPSENAALLHGLLIYVLTDKWLSPGSRLSSYVDKTFASASLPFDDRHIDETRRMEAGWILCTYYEAKRSGVLPAIAKLVPGFQLHLRAMLKDRLPSPAR